MTIQGTKSNPYTTAPPEWDKSGVPYGAFCKCAQCEYVGTSTNSFDYRADSPGDPLICDACKGFSTYATGLFLIGPRMPSGNRSGSLQLRPPS